MLTLGAVLCLAGSLLLLRSTTDLGCILATQVQPRKLLRKANLPA
jgi:hypothetical protein